jgi:hypothetical protein
MPTIQRPDRKVFIAISYIASGDPVIQEYRIKNGNTIAIARPT